MNHETMRLLEQQFDTAFAAPDGIQKLRELILTLAMQGKLVPQDPNDQPASELLKEIELEKQQLVKEGKIKQSKPLPKITPEDVPHDLPKGWEWTRLNEALDVRDGTHDTPKYVDIGYPLITSKNLYTGMLNFENVKFISKEDHKK
jgi:type I restriction enzyme S subunit